MTDPPEEDNRRISVRYKLGGSIKYCPMCLGPLEITNFVSASFVPTDYYCAKCGYSGFIYLEQDTAEQDVEDKNK